MSYQELEQDPFDPDEFVERLAWRTTGGISKATADDFDPMALHEAFENMIKDLKDLSVQTQERTTRLEEQCKKEEEAHWQRVGALQKNNQLAFQKFQELDERINYVATKVVHLGDQLENVNTPRARAAEAQKLMQYFSEFLNNEGPTSDLFSDPFKLYQAADVMQKLHLIVQELPPGEKFEKAKLRIGHKYDQIERDLIEDFVRSQQNGDKARMKEIAGVLANFKGYNQCIDAFIEQCQYNAFLKPDVFADAFPLCMKTSELINECFTNPEPVMAKFVLNIYEGKIKEHITTKLMDTEDQEKYLKNVYELYTKTVKLSNDLSVLRLGSDSTFLTKITKNIFHRYLETYIGLEIKFLRDRCTAVLQRYYENKGHQKKNIQTGGQVKPGQRIHDFRREFQAVIGQKANINIGPSIENYGGETFLSHETVINVLQETKFAFKRCQALSSQNSLAENAVQIFEVLVQYMCIEHILYAIDIGLQAIPLPDAKQQPEIYFFDVVGQSNTIFHLFEKQFSDNLVPLVSLTQYHSECAKKKKDLMEHMENKLDIGLDRTLNAMTGWVRHILQTEQKKTDFNPVSDDAQMMMFSPACAKVVKYITSQLKIVKDGLDGKNVENVLREWGVRIHRAIYEHMQQFLYNSMGGMLAICDVNEYRKCMKAFQVPLVNQLFDTLHSLCNLLVVVPDNLKQVCTGEHMAGLDKSALLSFVQLRADYKTAKIAVLMR
ncbi:unnamed protein product [Owenia fusiformis]|uniref:Exocyst complex component 5 n=1 Tax=Owenia fusiformis TaxID=6347 RepID=A0A8S4PIS6_OWEFU|nr:unnamed protein product [Owenia fusiformis]